MQILRSTSALRVPAANAFVIFGIFLNGTSDYDAHTEERTACSGVVGLARDDFNVTSFIRISGAGTVLKNSFGATADTLNIFFEKKD